ncbi:hypothetical protein BB561_001157 [Smittium simulii]|uniref:histidine kinase n=1 Tax=Smittium simulii TaxID=133385 RepID=A0A2T9YVW1_9FUNG|nr:hypothetical protein BB561_001157 [Smittium simulii]
MKYEKSKKGNYSRVLLSAFSREKSRHMNSNDSKFNINPFEKMSNPFKSRRRKLWNIGEAEKSKMNHFTFFLYLSDKIKALISKFTNEYSSLTDQAEVNNLYNYFFDLSTNFMFFGYYAIFIFYKLFFNFLLPASVPPPSIFSPNVFLTTYQKLIFSFFEGLNFFLNMLTPKYSNVFLFIICSFFKITNTVVALLFFPYLFILARRTKKYSLILSVILLSSISSVLFSINIDSWNSLWFPMSISYVMFVLGFSLDHIKNSFLFFLPFILWLFLLFTPFDLSNSNIFSIESLSSKTTSFQQNSVFGLTLLYFRSDLSNSFHSTNFTEFVSKVIQSILISISTYLFGYFSSQAVFICIETACITSSETMVLSHKQMQLVSQLSHELRTPISAIIGWNELMMVDETIHSDHRATMSHIHEASLHLLDLLNTILDVSKLGAKKMELRNGYFDLHETILSVAQFMMGLATEKHLELLIDYPNDIPINYIGDHGRIRQILLNLLSNAIKFTQRGGEVKILVRNLGTTTSKSIIDISVEDTGCGIPIELHSLLFREFVQIGNNDSTQAKLGTGLGLYLVKNLVEMMGGRVWVKSMPNVGSTFGVRIPLLRQPHSDDIDLKSNSNYDKLSKSSGTNKLIKQFNMNMNSLKDSSSSINSSSYLMLKASTINKMSSQSSNINVSRSYISNSILEYSEEGSIERQLSFGSEKRNINPFGYASTKKSSSEVVSNYLTPNNAANLYGSTIKKISKMDTVVIGVSKRFNSFLQHVCQNNWHCKDVQLLNLKQNKIQDLMLDSDLVLDQNTSDNNILNISAPVKVFSNKKKIPIFFIDLANIEHPLAWKKSEFYSKLIENQQPVDTMLKNDKNSDSSSSTDSIYEVLKSISCWLLEAAEYIITNSAKAPTATKENTHLFSNLILSSSKATENHSLFSDRRYNDQEEHKMPDLVSYNPALNSSNSQEYLDSRFNVNINYNTESFIKSAFNDSKTSLKQSSHELNSVEKNSLDPNLNRNNLVVDKNARSLKLSDNKQSPLQNKVKIDKGVVVFFIGHEQINLSGAREILEDYFQVVLCRKPSSEPMILDFLKPIVSNPESIFKRINQSNKAQEEDKINFLSILNSSNQENIKYSKNSSNFGFNNRSGFTGLVKETNLIHQNERNILDNSFYDTKFNTNVLSDSSLDHLKNSDFYLNSNRALDNQMKAQNLSMNQLEADNIDYINAEPYFNLKDDDNYPYNTINQFKTKLERPLKTEKSFFYNDYFPKSAKSEPLYSSFYTQYACGSMKKSKSSKKKIKKSHIFRSKSYNDFKATKKHESAFDYNFLEFTATNSYFSEKLSNSALGLAYQNSNFLASVDSESNILNSDEKSQDEKIVITNRRGFSWTFLPNIGFLPPSFKLSDEVSTVENTDKTSQNKDNVNKPNLQNIRVQKLNIKQNNIMGTAGDSFNSDQIHTSDVFKDSLNNGINSFNNRDQSVRKYQINEYNDLDNDSFDSKKRVNSYPLNKQNYINSNNNEISESSGYASDDKGSANYFGESSFNLQKTNYDNDISSFNIKRELNPHLTQTMNSIVSKFQESIAGQSFKSSKSKSKKIKETTLSSLEKSALGFTNISPNFKEAVNPLIKNYDYTQNSNVKSGLSSSALDKELLLPNPKSSKAINEIKKIDLKNKQIISISPGLDGCDLDLKTPKGSKSSNNTKTISEALEVEKRNLENSRGNINFDKKSLSASSPKSSIPAYSINEIHDNNTTGKKLKSDMKFYNKASGNDDLYTRNTNNSNKYISTLEKYCNESAQSMAQLSSANSKKYAVNSILNNLSSFTEVYKDKKTKLDNNRSLSPILELEFDKKLEETESHLASPYLESVAFGKSFGMNSTKKLTNHITDKSVKLIDNSNTEKATNHRFLSKNFIDSQTIDKNISNYLSNISSTSAASDALTHKMNPLIFYPKVSNSINIPQESKSAKVAVNNEFQYDEQRPLSTKKLLLADKGCTSYTNEPTSDTVSGLVSKDQFYANESRPVSYEHIFRNIKTSINQNNIKYSSLHKLKKDSKALFDTGSVSNSFDLSKNDLRNLQDYDQEEGIKSMRHDINSQLMEQSTQSNPNFDSSKISFKLKPYIFDKSKNSSAQNLIDIDNSNILTDLNNPNSNIDLDYASNINVKGNAMSMILSRKNKHKDPEHTNSYRNAISKYIHTNPGNENKNANLTKSSLKNVDFTNNLLDKVENSQDFSGLEQLKIDGTSSPQLVSKYGNNSENKLNGDKKHKLLDILLQIGSPNIHQVSNGKPAIQDSNNVIANIQSNLSAKTDLNEFKNDITVTKNCFIKGMHLNGIPFEKNENSLDKLIRSKDLDYMTPKPLPIDSANINDADMKREKCESFAFSNSESGSKNGKTHKNSNKHKEKSNKANLQPGSSVKSNNTSNSSSYREKFSNLYVSDYGNIHKLPIKTPVLYNLNMDLSLPNTSEQHDNNMTHNLQPRILVADDSSINRMLLITQLKKLGIKNVDSAADGVAACRQFQVGKYNLVFMDIQMPLVDGYQATKYIRAAEEKYKKTKDSSIDSKHKFEKLSLTDKQCSVDNKIKIDDLANNKIIGKSGKSINNEAITDEGNVSLDNNYNNVSNEGDLNLKQYQKLRGDIHSVNLQEGSYGNSSKNIENNSGSSIPRVIILALTADTSVRDSFEKDSLNSKLTGFDCVYCKPMDLNVLFSTINKWLPWVVFSKHALLSQIQKGKALKKAVTNDRSAPQLGNKTTQSNTNSNYNAPTIAAQETRKNTPNVPAVPVGIGNIFANGIPTLKSRQGGIKTDKLEELNTVNAQSKPSWSKNSINTPSTQAIPSAKTPNSNYSSSSTITGFQRNSSDKINLKTYNNQVQQSQRSDNDRNSGEILVGTIKKKPPPPPPSKSKPSFLFSSSSNNSIAGTPKFPTSPRGSLNNISLTPKLVDSNGDSIRRGSSPNTSQLNPNFNSLNSLPTLPASNKNSSFSNSEMKWEFHSQSTFPTFSFNQIPRNKTYEYPSGKKCSFLRPTQSEKKKKNSIQTFQQTLGMIYTLTFINDTATTTTQSAPLKRARGLNHRSKIFIFEHNKIATLKSMYLNDLNPSSSKPLMNPTTPSELMDAKKPAKPSNMLSHKQNRQHFCNGANKQLDLHHGGFNQ